MHIGTYIHIYALSGNTHHNMLKTVLSIYFHVYLGMLSMSAHAVLLIPFKAAWLKCNFNKAGSFDEFSIEGTKF